MWQDPRRWVGISVFVHVHKNMGSWAQTSPGFASTSPEGNDAVNLRESSCLLEVAKSLPFWSWLGARGWGWGHAVKFEGPLLVLFSKKKKKKTL